MKEYLAKIVFFVVLIIGILFLIFRAEASYNNVSHDDDVIMTEWISPDGVHYWYQQAGYHAMLAPRYDAEGNLVIEE